MSQKAPSRTRREIILNPVSSSALLRVSEGEENLDISEEEGPSEQERLASQFDNFCHLTEVFYLLEEYCREESLPFFQENREDKFDFFLECHSPDSESL